MLRQRMGGAGIRLHSTLLKRSPHDGEAGGVADSGAQCPVTGAGGPGGDDGKKENGKM
jgi:hypothetical protein